MAILIRILIHAKTKLFTKSFITLYNSLAYHMQKHNREELILNTPSSSFYYMKS